MKKITILFFILFVAFSCKDKLEDNEQRSETRSLGSAGDSITIGLNSLGENSLDIDLGREDEFEIHARAVLSTGFRISYFNFYMKPVVGTIPDGYWSFGSFKQNDFDSDGNYSETFRMFRGGDFKIWCEIVFEDIEDYSVKTVKSEEVSLNVLYPDQANIKDYVRNDMEDLWKKSISDTNLAEMREFGFYITMSRGGDGVLTMQPVKICEGEKNICPRKGEEVVNTVKLEGDEYDAPTIEPFREVEYLIAQFHTHPPLTNCSPETKRKGGVGPSKIDKDNINARDPYIPAFVYDYENNITGGHSPHAEAKIYHYGADRRKDFY